MTHLYGELFLRYHGEWRGETQEVVSMLIFMHWLETGGLLMHAEVQEKLGCMSGRCEFLHWFAFWHSAFADTS
jgi:hypothetical protein